VTDITDDFMHDMLSRSKTYSLLVLRATPKRQEPGADAIVWEHGRRNFSLRSDGVLAIVCRIVDDSEWSGLGIFDATPEEVVRIMAEDPAVEAGIFTYEVHPIRGFPGDGLPA
jgi:hypothetical protein